MGGVLGTKTWVDELGGDASKSYLKREDREGVEGPVMTELLPSWTEKWNRKCLPRPEAIEGEKGALPRKLILSIHTWNRMACPAESVSISPKKPSTETYVLSYGIGFWALYFFKLKWARTGRMESARLFL